MKRVLAIMLALVFAVGALIVPAMHKAGCAEAHSAHGPASCSICQLAGAPLLASVWLSAPTVTPVVRCHAALPVMLPPPAAVRRPGQARAPPAT